METTKQAILKNLKIVLSRNENGFCLGSQDINEKLGVDLTAENNTVFLTVKFFRDTYDLLHNWEKIQARIANVVQRALKTPKAWEIYFVCILEKKPVTDEDFKITDLIRYDTVFCRKILLESDRMKNLEEIQQSFALLLPLEIETSVEGIDPLSALTDILSEFGYSREFLISLRGEFEYYQSHPDESSLGELILRDSNRGEQNETP